MPAPTNCLECDAPLGPSDTGGVCPKCLLKLGLASQLASGSLPATARGLRDDGTIEEPFDFGGYQILRLLGKGGMGAVYEAEHRESGRRVALKVLGQTLDTPEMRARFLREGQLAAAVRHPNVVAVLGAEEVEGTPVIAMELLHDGTLKDRVKKRGPLPVAEAVDAALQIIDGLESAHAAGVLHRDVKPANCFGARDGTVKVGDFGLSISTLVKAEHSLTQSGAVLGTPAFAAPEQLRGVEIDARADIYAVGATLYFLLTGKPTHDAETLVGLIAAVLERKPTDARELRSEIPRSLNQAVMRCLEKDPARRFPNYAALRAALVPFSSAAPSPAKPGIRFVAGVVDTIFTMWLELIALGALGETTDALFISTRSLSTFAFWFGSGMWAIAWFGVSEAIFGTTLGKYLCGMRVATLTGQPPGWCRALSRSLIYNLGLLVMPPIAIASYSADRYRSAVASGEFLPTDLIMFSLWMVLFVTMRSRNGWATVHDLLTGTRVVVNPRTDSDAASPIEVPARQITLTGEKVGAYAVAKRSPGLIEAFDENLRRGVWIVPAEPTAESISQSRREVSRPTRLRWLQGTRSNNEAWDAYEAPPGIPLTALLDNAQPWARVRCWLGDIADEANAGLRDGTIPPAAGLDRVWIAREGRAVLLDFPGPGSPPVESTSIRDSAGLQRFLTSIADAALSPVRPLHAAELIDTLRTRRLEDPALVAGNIRAAMAESAVISPQRRVFSVALWPAISLVLAFILGAIIAHEYRWFDRVWNEHYRELPSLRRATDLRIDAIPQSLVKDSEPPLDALNTHIAGYYHGVIKDDAFWDRPEVQAVYWPAPGRLRRELREIVKTRGAVTSAQLREADSRLAPAFAKWEERDRHIGRTVGFVFFAGSIGLGILTSLIWTFWTGSPLALRICGFSLVRWSDGHPAGRFRAALRLIAGWIPFGFTLTLLGVIGLMDAGIGWIALALGANLAVIAIALLLAVRRPGRGIADQLCGTAIVPR